MSRFSVPPGPILGAIMMSGLAFTLIAIVIARSPYTHGNLRPEGYNRTEIAYVGEEPPFEGLGLADPRVASTGDPVQDGRALFFQYGCASCHGLKGQGGAVGLELDLDDLSLVDFHKEVRRGPKGMPAFMEGVLTDEEIDEMYAFLESISEGLPGGEAPPSPEPTPAATPTPPTPAPTPTVAPTPTLATGTVLQAARATITVDGDNSDWADIAGLSVTLKQPDYTGTDFEVPDPVGPIDAVVKVAIDDQNIYVLYEVSDDYDFDPADHNFSASPNVMFLIDPAAGPHMGADDPDFETGLGMVDIWHWELDCDYTVVSGGGDPASGNDPDCNLDDEFSTDPEEREDDGGGDVANPNAENSISGAWEHTARASGIGAAGTWIFEFSRPLQTGDPEDAQFTAGGTAMMALAYFDADETVVGWSDTGHATSADEGWIMLLLP